MILFEFPLTETVRTWLRLEAAWARWTHFSAGETLHEHHAALNALFECVDIAGRSDLKRHLIAALEAIGTPTLETSAPRPHRLVLTNGQQQATELIAQLYQQPARLDQLVRHHPLLDTLRTRTHLPGGVGSFDLPTYHYWLMQESAARRRQLAEWVAPAAPLFAALACVLAHLRAQGKAQTVEAIGGTFQQPLLGTLPPLVQVWVAAEARAVPKIAANKYQLNLHFLSVREDGTLADRYAGPERLPFRLALCG